MIKLPLNILLVKSANSTLEAQIKFGMETSCETADREQHPQSSIMQGNMLKLSNAALHCDKKHFQDNKQMQHGSQGEWIKHLFQNQIVLEAFAVRELHARVYG